MDSNEKIFMVGFMILMITIVLLIAGGLYNQIQCEMKGGYVISNNTNTTYCAGTTCQTITENHGLVCAYPNGGNDK